MKTPKTKSRRGFALPLVLLLALVGSMAAAMMLTRSGSSRRAVQRQVEAYQLHHMRAGLQEILSFWSSVYVRSPTYGQPEGVWGFDCELEGTKVTIRLQDAQGTPRLDNTHPDASIAGMMERAAELYAARTGKPLSMLRQRGPSLLSINSASAEALECLILAIDPEARAAEFASQVISRRTPARIDKAQEIMELCRTAGLEEASVHKLAAMLTTDPMVWRVSATIVDSSGKVLAEQGGIGIGAVRPSQATSGTNWALLTWGDVGDANTFAGLGN